MPGAAAFRWNAQMPSDGTIGGLVGKLDVLRIGCPACGRQGRYHIARLLAELGPAAQLTDRLNERPADCPQRTRPASLEEALVDEWPGILRWMINGAVDWYANGSHHRPWATARSIRAAARLNQRRNLGWSLDPATLEEPLVGCVLFDIRCFSLFRDVLRFRVLSSRVLMRTGFVFRPFVAAIGGGYGRHMTAHRALSMVLGSRRPAMAQASADTQ
jgi:hypothetical protein